MNPKKNTKQEQLSGRCTEKQERTQLTRAPRLTRWEPSRQLPDHTDHATAGHNCGSSRSLLNAPFCALTSPSSSDLQQPHDGWLHLKVFGNRI